MSKTDCTRSIPKLDLHEVRSSTALAAMVSSGFGNSKARDGVLRVGLAGRFPLTTGAKDTMMDTLFTNDQRLPTWRDWLATGARKLVRDAAALFEAIAAYNERARERYVLCTLDDRMMKDIGITRADIWLECSKPFWRP